MAVKQRSRSGVNGLVIHHDDDEIEVKSFSNVTRATLSQVTHNFVSYNLAYATQYGNERQVIHSRLFILFIYMRTCSILRLVACYL